MHAIPIAIHVAIATAAHAVRSKARRHPSGIESGLGVLLRVKVTAPRSLPGLSVVVSDAEGSEFAVMFSAKGRVA